MIGTVTVLAQYSITMKLKNGSELYGYIADQVPGKNFVFNATKSYIYLDGKEVVTTKTRTVEYKDLSESWQKWAEENNTLKGSGAKQCLDLYDIVLKGKVISNVRLLEKGVKFRYLSCDETRYNLGWEQIESVEGSLRPKNLLSGIDRIYKLSNGEQIKGQYIKEIPGEIISLYTESGMIEVFDVDRIVRESKIQVNNEQSMIEQSELLDVLTLKNGSIVDGLIFERNYSTNPDEEYLMIKTGDNLTQSLKLSEIHQYGKRPNPAYSPEYDIELANGEIALFRNIVPKASDVKITEDGYSAVRDSIMTTISREKANKAFIEGRFGSENDARSIKIVATNQAKEIVKTKKGKVEVTKYYVKYSDMVNMAIQCQGLSVSVNGIYKLTYSLPYEGVYFIYDPSNQSIRMIEVIN